MLKYFALILQKIISILFYDIKYLNWHYTYSINVQFSLFFIKAIKGYTCNKKWYKNKQFI